MLKEKQINFFVEKILLKNPNLFKLTEEEFSNLVFPNKDVEIIKEYGQGVSGLVLKVKKEGQLYAVKLTVVRNSRDKTLEEYIIQKRFAEYNMSPKIYDIEIMDYKFRGIRVNFVRAFMDPIYMDLFNYLNEGKPAEDLIEPLKCLIQKKYTLDYPEPFLHGDMHLQNIVILKDKKTLGFIDFGWTSHKPAFMQLLDCIPLITFLRLYGSSKALVELLIEHYNKMFRIKLDPNSFQELTLRIGGKEIGQGYCYRSNGIVLHSYNWIAQPDIGRVALPTQEQIETVFPTIKFPRVK